VWFARFLKSNILYIFWFAIYFTIAWFIFGGNLRALIIVAVIYAISISVALSPIGEVLLRLVENCREPLTEQEKSYLLPIFEEVYQSAKEINKNLNSGIKIYIMDAMYVNAFAIGRKTVAVTKGALETFTEEELKGVLAHELGHMTYGHTKALLLTVIGNFLFSIITFVLRIILRILEFVSKVVALFNVLGIIFTFLTFIVRIIFEASVFLIQNSSQLFLSINSRSNELIADKFAYDIGFGDELIKSLYVLQKISINTKLKISEKLMASHPHMAFRIAQLERMENENV